MSFFSFDSFQLLANSAETCNIRDQVLHIVAATGGNRDQQVQNSTCHPDWLIAVAVSSFTRFSLDRHVFFVQNEKSFKIYLNIVHPDDRVRYISLWIICYLNGSISRLVIIIYSCCGTTSASFLIVCVQHL